MITSRTKKQLVVFVIITLLGVSYVGARYAQLNRLIYNPVYDVNAQFTQSGGIFAGAEVDYRGVTVGKVSNMVLTRKGVTVVLAINNGHKNIPANTIARVANRSAVGEQYVDLEPRTRSGPFLHNGSQIPSSDTRVPVSTTALLTNLDALIRSVPQKQLRTVVTELGTAFHGTGGALAEIINDSTSFLKTANANFATTSALIKDSSTVLQTQVDETGAIRTFSRDLQLFTDTLAGHDKSLRAVIDSGSATADELKTFLQQNQVNLGALVANLDTTGKIVVKHLAGIRQILVLYPYMVAGAYTVTEPGPGGVNARFGLILTQSPAVCEQGYHTKMRDPSDLSEVPMDTKAGCTAAPPINARGAHNAPGASGSDYRVPVASYDSSTGTLSWAGDEKAGAARSTTSSADAATMFGKDSWKWMLLEPALPPQD